ncbi:hypothetical protein NMG60_11024067 [Bertholletia excelsa]
MNQCRFQESGMFACGEMGGPSICVSDSVFCPKPRRIGVFNPSYFNHHIQTSIWYDQSVLYSHQRESFDSIAGTELLDIILTKGNSAVEKSNNEVASSPPFFCGSPPSRASNPLIQDAQFGKDKYSPSSQESVPATSSPPARTGTSCVRVKFAHNPAAVRIEGFKCLSQDMRSISAVA